MTHYTSRRKINRKSYTSIRMITYRWYSTTCYGHCLPITAIGYLKQKCDHTVSNFRTSVILPDYICGISQRTSYGWRVMESRSRFVLNSLSLRRSRQRPSQPPTSLSGTSTLHPDLVTLVRVTTDPSPSGVVRITANTSGERLRTFWTPLGWKAR